jgi:GH25 family lysozyme M1 (1,4-beta-N-acetylmuramidase)
VDILGVDLSSHNPYVAWPDAVGAGVAFAIPKATEGVGYRNPLYDDQVWSARNSGVAVGHYHFARPDLADGASGEARYFLDRRAAPRGGESLWLDLEVPGGNLSRYALDWLTLVEEVSGITPGIYLNRDYIENRGVNDPALARFPLWYAWWPDDPAREQWPQPPAPWAEIAVWQYTGGSPLAGFRQPVDLNRCASVEAFRALGLPGVSAQERARQALWAWYVAKPDWERGVKGLARWFSADFADYGIPGPAYGLVYEHGAAYIAADGVAHAIQPELWGDWQQRAAIE